jgi:uncharacterized protein (DUF302 family)
MSKSDSIPFQGVRVVVSTAIPFDEVLARLGSLMGRASMEDLYAVTEQAASRETFEQEVQRRFVGESGFMKFGEIDHGGWLGLFGIHRRTVRWIFGNPLIAVTMIEHDLTAGLFAPVEMLITERENEDGADLTDVLPSSLMVIENNPPLRTAAEALDAKIAALIENVVNPQRSIPRPSTRDA